MTEAYILCLVCRGTFTDEQTKGQNGCPTCGNQGVPGDTRKKATLTLTHHEWRVLFMFAENWAARCERTDPRPKSNVTAAIQAITREAGRQAPDISSLSVLGDIQEAVNVLGTKAELYGPDGVQTIEPEKKH